MSGYDSHAVIVKLCVLYNCTKLYKNALIRAVTDPEMDVSGNRVTDFPADIDTDDMSVTLMAVHRINMQHLFTISLSLCSKCVNLAGYL